MSVIHIVMLQMSAAEQHKCTGFLADGSFVVLDLDIKDYSQYFVPVEKPQKQWKPVTEKIVL